MLDPDAMVLDRDTFERLLDRVERDLVGAIAGGLDCEGEAGLEHLFDDELQLLGRHGDLPRCRGIVAVGRQQRCLSRPFSPPSRATLTPRTCSRRLSSSNGPAARMRSNVAPASAMRG